MYLRLKIAPVDGSKKGTRFDIGPAHNLLRKTNLEGQILSGALLSNAIFKTTNLRSADLRYSTLCNAQFNRVDLSDADLRHSDLRGANLKEVENLKPWQLGGANLDGAKLPESVAKFETLGGMNQAAAQARAVFITVIMAAFFCLLTISQTKPAQLISMEDTLALPFLGTKVPVRGFFCLAPVALLVAYTYFLFALQILWERIAIMPAIFPEGQTLPQRAMPWTLLSVCSNFNDHLRRESHVNILRNLVFMLFAWLFVPFVCFVFAYKVNELPLIPVSKWCDVCAIASLYLFFYFVHDTYLKLKAKETPTHKVTLVEGFRNWLNWRNGLLVFLIAALFVLWVFLWPLDSGSNALNLQMLDLSDGKFKGMNFEYANFDGADLHDADLRGSDLRNCSLVNAKLQGAKLQGANLSGANLSNSDLSDVSIDNANLTDAILVGIKLTQSVELNKANLQGADLSGLNLQERMLNGSRLSGANLKSADLRGAQLELANLTGANLNEADLREANVRLALFHSANMDGANLSGIKNLGNFSLIDEDSWNEFERAERKPEFVKDPKFRGKELNLKSPTLRGADLSRIDFKHFILRGFHFEGVDLGEAHLEGADLDEAHMECARLQSAHLEGAHLKNAFLEGADLGNVHLEGAYLYGIHLEGADLFKAHLEGVYLMDARLEGSSLRLCHLECADLEKAHLEGAKLDFAELQGARLVSARLDGADLTRAKLTPVRKSFEFVDINCDRYAAKRVWTISNKKNISVDLLGANISSVGQGEFTYYRILNRKWVDISLAEFESTWEEWVKAKDPVVKAYPSKTALYSHFKGAYLPIPKSEEVTREFEESSCIGKDIVRERHQTIFPDKMDGVFVDGETYDILKKEYAQSEGLIIIKSIYNNPLVSLSQICELEESKKQQSEPESVLQQALPIESK